MTENDVARAERSSEALFSGTKNGHHRYSDECGKVHRSGVISKKKTTGAQLGNQLGQARLADAINAPIAELVCNCASNFRIDGRAEKVPLH